MQDKINRALRNDLLVDRKFLLAGNGPIRSAVELLAPSLGGQTESFPADSFPLPDTISLLVCDLTADPNNESSRQGIASMRARIDNAWACTHRVVNELFLTNDSNGKIVYVAPAANQFEHAAALRSGAENLSRTLSIEWARYGITTTTLLLGESTEPSTVAELIAYLTSPAGEYFSGCSFSFA